MVGITLFLFYLGTALWLADGVFSWQDLGLLVWCLAIWLMIRLCRKLDR